MNEEDRDTSIPSPLLEPYRQQVHNATFYDEPFEPLQHDIAPIKPETLIKVEHDANNDTNNDTMIKVELIKVNKFNKLKSELKHRWRTGKQIIPLKASKLFNFIQNDQTMIDPNDKTLNKEALETVIRDVVEWFFNEGLTNLTLANNDKIISESDQKTDENQVDLTLKSLGALSIKTRDYQQKLFEAAIKQNIICFMPTGSGKTRIAIKLIEYRLKQIYLHKTECIHKQQLFIKRYIIFLVCTTHLAQQQTLAIKRCIPFIKIRKITGDNNPDQWLVNNWRVELDHYDVLVMMHDCLKGALQHGHISFDTIDTLILDECHHVGGGKRHPYTVLMEKYHQYKSSNPSPHAHLPKIMGLTASPIKNKEFLSEKILMKIKELQTMMDAVLMRVDNAKLRTVVAEPVTVRYPYIPMDYDISNKMFTIPDIFKKTLEKYVKMVNRIPHVTVEMGMFGACVMLRLFVEKLDKRNARRYSQWDHGNKKEEKERLKIANKEKAMNLFKRFMNEKMHHFDEYLHTTYDDTEWTNDRKRDISMKIENLMKFIADSHDGIEMIPINEENKENEENNEDIEGIGALNTYHDVRQRGIIFVEERLMAYTLAEILSIRFKDLHFGVLTGHSCNLWGMNDRDQCKVIKKFKNGDINYLIATSVAEEGIDIQSCNCVIMLALPKNVKTYIQTRGRMRRKLCKYVVFCDPNNDDEQRQLMLFEQTEKDMVQHANNDDIKDDIMTYDRYEYVVPSTNAFASTINAVSMLHRYLSVLGITKNEIIRSYARGVHGYLLTMEITSYKWEMQARRIFCNTASNQAEAQRKVCVDIITALKEEGYWNDNLVPIEILKRNTFTQALNKQRALCRSEPIDIHIPSEFSSKFEQGPQREINIMDDTGFEYQVPTANNKIGYLYHIAIHNDPNHFPMGILLPKQVPIEYLKYIHFPIKVRERSDIELQKYLFEYAKLVREALATNEDKQDDECTDQCRKRKRKTRYVSTNVQLQSASGKNNAVYLTNDRFNDLVQYHQTVFEILDRGGSKKKKPLRRIVEEQFDENERFYILCPLTLLTDGYAMDDYGIDWRCIDKILHLNKFWQRNVETNSEYCKSYGNDSEFQLVMTKTYNGYTRTYISYGVDHAFTTDCLRPHSDQVIADHMDDDEIMNKIFHCNVALDCDKQHHDSDNDDDNEDGDALLSDEGGVEDACIDEIDVKSDATKYKLKTVSIDEQCKYLISTSDDSKSNNDILILRLCKPKIRNVLLLNAERTKYKKQNLKAATDFVPLKNIFFTGITSSHFYQLLNIPSILWRLEHYFNIFDAHRVLKSISRPCDIDCDLLFEALCNASADAGKTYERLECLGDTVLKCMTSIYGVFTMHNANQGVLTIWKSNVVCNNNLREQCKSLNLVSYGIFKSFSFNLWHPSYFKSREGKNNSLYKDVQISLKLPADIIESILGALWSTINDNGNDLSDLCSSLSISSCVKLLKDIKILEREFVVHEKFKELTTEWQNGSFAHIIGKSEFQQRIQMLVQYYYTFQSNRPIVAACLIELLDPFYHYHPHDLFKEYGISYQRLEFLGDAILDLIVTQFLYKDMLKKGNDAFLNSKHGLSVEGEMTLRRSNIVSNDALGYNFVHVGLEGCIIWTERQLQLINEYKKDIAILRDTIGEVEDNWYIQAQAPKCLADAFEVLLAIVFIDSNYEMFENEKHEIKVKNCFDFVCVYHDYAKRYWIHEWENEL